MPLCCKTRTGLLLSPGASPTFFPGCQALARVKRQDDSPAGDGLVREEETIHKEGELASRTSGACLKGPGDKRR